MLKDHNSHVCQVLKCLKKARIKAYINKFEFYVYETKFFGFIISTKDI